MANKQFNQTRISKIAIYCIAALALFLFASPIQWYGKQLLLDPFKVVILIVLPLVWYLRYRSIERTFPHFSLFPVLLFWLSVIFYLANENYLGVNIFSATFFIIGLYSLLGMVLPPQQWWELFLPFCLIILLLPFEGYLDIYLGFPLRLLCAQWAGEILQVFGINSMSHESIILIEEKAANVDLACSGIRGLWAGGIFYLILSMIEDCKVSLRWFVIGTIFLACLLMANVFRIVVLVFLELVADLAPLADLVHLSLGLLGFSISCLLVWLGLRITRKPPDAYKPQQSNQGNSSLISQILFIAGLFFAIWLHQPYHPDSSLTPMDPQLPAILNPSIVPLTSVELDFFHNNHASTRKMQIEFGDMTGSVMIVSSTYWKGQHEPRNCYIGQGHSLGYEGSWLLNNNTVVRFMQVDNATKTAIYWFQSIDRVTGNYSSRVFGGILEPQTPWLMVSILWDSPVNQKEIEKVLVTIQASLANQLKPENKDEK